MLIVSVPVCQADQACLNPGERECFPSIMAQLDAERFC